MKQVSMTQLCMLLRPAVGVLVGPRTAGNKLVLSLQNLDHLSIITTYAHVVFMVFSGNVSWQQGARGAAHGPVQQPHVEAHAYLTIYAVEGLDHGLHMRECSCWAWIMVCTCVSAAVDLHQQPWATASGAVQCNA